MAAFLLLRIREISSQSCTQTYKNSACKTKTVRDRQNAD